MVTGQLNMQKDTSIIKMMKHDIRSPLSCLMTCCDHAMALTNVDKDALLDFTEQILKILDSATDIDLFIHDMAITLDSCKNYCNQAPRILDYDKETIFHYIDRIAMILTSPSRQARSPSLKNNEINVIASINNILQEKKLEYLDSNMTFLFNKSENIENLRISGSVDAFERMLSNLLNNSVEACSGKQGLVSINLEITDQSLYLIIEDNGKGIPENILQQIRSGISITHGKEKGQGLGLTQIRETISCMHGKLIIKSEIGHGSKFIITIDRFIKG